MSGFSVDDVISLSDGIARASFDDSEWPIGMSRVRSALGAAAAYVGVFDCVRGGGDRIYGDCEPEYNYSFVNPELCNPLTRQIAPAAPGTLHTAAGLEDPNWTSGTFYNEWCRPQDLHHYVQTKLLRKGDIVVCSGVLRGPRQDDFDAHSLELFRHLIPALHDAAKLRLRFGALRLSGRADALEALSTGFIVVDRQARVLYCNATADRLLTDGDIPIDAVGKVLSLPYAADRDRLRRAIATAISGTPPQGSDLLVTPAEAGSPALALGVSPLPDAGLLGLDVARAAVVTLRVARSQPQDFATRLGTLFDLTAREAQLAGVLAAGGTLQDYVDDRGIGMPTGRSQLGALLRKTGTTRQGELLTLLLTALPPR